MSLQLIKRLETLDYLISSRMTGSPAALAEKLNISERGLYLLLEKMRELGAPVSYDKTRKSYYYTETGHFHAGFKKLKPPPEPDPGPAAIIMAEPSTADNTLSADEDTIVS